MLIPTRRAQQPHTPGSATARPFGGGPRDDGGQRVRPDGTLFGTQSGCRGRRGIGSASWQYASLPLLAVVTCSAIGAGVLLARVQRAEWEQDPRWQRSRARARAAVVLVIAGGVLAAIAGVVSNIAAGSLPPDLTTYGVPLFVGVTLAAIGAGVLLAWVQRVPPRLEATNRRNFLHKLQERSSRRQEDALRGATLLALGLEEAPEAVAAARPVLALLPLRAVQDIGRYQLFIAGALPGIPIPIGAEALEWAAAEAARELDITQVPRIWLQLLAQRRASVSAR
jgi:hypothetical protein